MTSHSPVKLAFSTVEPNGGASGKPPIVFAHGLTSCKEHWDNITQAVANATKRKVYAIDARNHGDSEWSNVFNFDCNVDDLLHFMDSERILKAVIVGHSMGGVTAIKTALTSPERIEKLIVEDMSVKKLPQQFFTMIPRHFAMARHALQQVPDGVDEATAKTIIVKFILDNIPKEAESYIKPKSLEELIPLRLRRTKDGRYAYKTNYDAIENSLKNASDIMKEYEGVYEGPAFFIYGKLSPLRVEADKPNIRNFFPNAEFLGIKDASHTVHTDTPNEFIAAINDFISKDK